MTVPSITNVAAIRGVGPRMVQVILRICISFSRDKSKDLYNILHLIRLSQTRRMTRPHPCGPAQDFEYTTNTRSWNHPPDTVPACLTEMDCYRKCQQNKTFFPRSVVFITSAERIQNNEQYANPFCGYISVETVEIARSRSEYRDKGF